MCDFFSFVTEPETGNNSGKRFHFDWKYRKKDLEISSLLGNSYHHDSHSSICKYYKLNEDICNKYEFDPFEKVFHVDRINSEVDDSIQAEDWVRNLDFTKIIQPLIIKNFINPLRDLPENKEYINDDIILLLQNWSFAQNTIRRTVDHYLIKEVGSPVKDALYDHLRCSLFSQIWNLISLRMGNQDILWDSILNSIIAYMESFFIISHHISIESLNKLWNMGFIPSFDGLFWRLHSGYDADVVFKIKESDLSNFRIK